MEYTHVGRLGLVVSRLCLGTMNFGPHSSEADSHVIMDAAVANGINLVDTANVYGRHLGVGATEEILGRWVAKGGGRRDKVVLATKVYGTMGDWPNEAHLSKLAIIHQCEESPAACAPTASTSTRCTTSTVRHGGTRSGRRWNSSSAPARSSTWARRTSPGGTSRANEIAGYRYLGLATEQSLYNLTARTLELEVIPAVREYGMGLISYSPLAGGLLAGALSKVEEGAAAPSTCAARSRRTGRSSRPGRSSAPSWEKTRHTSRSRGCSTSRS